MRVLMGMPDKDSWGGPIYCEPPFVEALRQAGVEVDEEVYVYGDKGGPTTTMGRVSRVLASARALRRRTRSVQYDLVHLNTSFDEKCVLRDLTTLYFLRSSKVPVYLKMHGSIARFLETKSPIWRFLQKRIFALANGIGVLSTEERDNFVRVGCPPEKLSAAKLAVPAGDQKDPAFRSRHNIDAEAPILLFSSRFLRSKGLLDVIAACGELKDRGRTFILFCLGDGPARPEAEKLVDELRLRDNVRFFGYIPEVKTNAFHANSTILVFPTYHDEGFPVVVLKSLASGLPMITTRIRAAADHLAEPENCLWAKPRDAVGLAERIALLLDDATLRAAMSVNNRQLAVHFSPASVANEYVGIYVSIVSRR